MRFQFLFAALVVLFAAVAAIAGPVAQVAVTADTPGSLRVDAPIVRLRIDHVGGPIEVVGVDKDALRVELLDATNLPVKKHILRATPAMKATIEVVSPGNYLLRTTAPEGSTLGPTEAPEGFVSFGPGVRIQGNLRIDSTVGSLPTDAVGCTMKVYVPMKALGHLSAKTRFGGVVLRDLAFPDIGDEEEPKHVLHAATNAGRVLVSRVRNAWVYGPEQGMETRDSCKAQVMTVGYEAQLEALFR